MSLVEIPAHYCQHSGIRIESRWLPRIESICNEFDVKVSSGYRTVAQNNDAGGASNSDHLRGDAADFVGGTQREERLHTWAEPRFPYVEPMAESTNHVHISFRHLGKEPIDPQGKKQARPLAGKAFSRSLWRHCQANDVDFIAMAAVAVEEGVSGHVGDNGTSYGPWQLHKGGALPARWAKLPDHSSKANAWAWSDNGIAYAVRTAAGAGVAGLRGQDATHRLVYKFERPDKSVIAGEAEAAWAVYKIIRDYHAGPRAWVAASFHGPSGGGGNGGGGDGGGGGGGGNAPDVKLYQAGPAWTTFIRTFSRYIPVATGRIRAHHSHLRRKVG